MLALLTPSLTMRSSLTLLYSVAHENPHFIIRDCTGLEGAKTGRPSYGFENPLGFRLVYGRARFLKVDKILVDAHGCVNLHQRKRTGKRTGEQSSMGIPRSGNPLLLVVLVICTVSETRAQSSSPDAGCWSQMAQIPHDAVQFGHGVAEAPRNAIRPRNLKWELPIAAATGILVARVTFLPATAFNRYPFSIWPHAGRTLALESSWAHPGFCMESAALVTARNMLPAPVSRRSRLLVLQMESRLSSKPG